MSIPNNLGYLVSLDSGVVFVADLLILGALGDNGNLYDVI